MFSIWAVSYTHLDVYKRQIKDSAIDFSEAGLTDEQLKSIERIYVAAWILLTSQKRLDILIVQMEEMFLIPQFALHLLFYSYII